MERRSDQPKPRVHVDQLPQRRRGTTNRFSCSRLHLQRSPNQTAVPGARVIVVRLRAPLDVIHGRIYGRNHADPEWYLTAASELSRILDEQPIEDHLIDNGALSITETAREVLRVTRWAGLDRPD